MELLCEYKFGIKHIKGKENKVVDALSRKMHVMHVAISISTSDLKDGIKVTNNIDEFFQQVKTGLLQQGTTHKFEHYKLEGGILKYKNKVYILTHKT